MCNHEWDDEQAGLPCANCLAEGRYPCPDCIEAVAQHVCPVCADLEHHTDMEIQLCGLREDLSLLPLWSTLGGMGFMEAQPVAPPLPLPPTVSRKPRTITVSPIWRWV